MRSPQSINLVLMAGGTSLFACATVIESAQVRRHAQYCQDMRNAGVPDARGECTSHGSSGGGHYGGGGAWGASSRGSSSGHAAASVVRGGFGATGARFSFAGFHGFG